MQRIVLSHQCPGQHVVRLIQTGLNSFTVEYGSDVRQRLSYEGAAKEFGACVMHAAVCAGLIAQGERHA